MVSLKVIRQITFQTNTAATCSKLLVVAAVLLFELLTQVCNAICNLTTFSLGKLLCSLRITLLSVLVLALQVPILRSAPALNILCKYLVFRAAGLHCAIHRKRCLLPVLRQIGTARTFIQSFLLHYGLWRAWSGILILKSY